MKTMTFVCFLLMMSMATIGQSDERAAIAERFEAADGSGLSEILFPDLDMNILGSEATYSRAQAEMVLKRFFKGNAATAYTEEHTGKGKGKSSYSIGRLTTTKGAYRLSYFLDESDGVLLIKQLRIEEYD